MTMKNKKLFFAFILIGLFSFSLVSCDKIYQWMSQQDWLSIHGYYVDFGNGYIYCNGVIGKIDKYDRENGMHFFHDIVPTQVLNHSQDDNYMVVYQVPDLDDMRIDTVRMSQHEIDSIHCLYQKMLEIRDCYWIIRFKDCKVWGPMDFQTYQRMHDNLKIETDLSDFYENNYVGEKPPKLRPGMKLKDYIIKYHQKYERDTILLKGSQ